MRAGSLVGFALMAVFTLAVIYGYNRFSKSGGVAQLGVPKAA